MKKVVIVAPDFPPCNLTGVHRNRYLASHLKEYGWEPIVLTIREDRIKGRVDNNLVKLLPQDLRIIRTKTFKPNRLIGDSAIRAFYWHWKELRSLARTESIDFVFISLYPAISTLLGRLIFEEFKIPYAIDFQDPWVKEDGIRDPFLSKAWVSSILAHLLEPFVVRKASLIMSVADGYISGLLKRNPHLRSVEKLIFPIGFDPNDYNITQGAYITPYLFDDSKNAFNMIYAGALLPKAPPVLRVFMKALQLVEKADPNLFAQLKVHFVGTGKDPDDNGSYNVRLIAEEYGLYERCVIEHPARISYTDTLIHLKAASAILVIGSTEKAYTASKIFPALFAQKPVLAILHRDSSARSYCVDNPIVRCIDFSELGQLDKLTPEIQQLVLSLMQQHSEIETRVLPETLTAILATNCAREVARRMDQICST